MQQINQVNNKDVAIVDIRKEHENVLLNEEVFTTNFRD